MELTTTRLEHADLVTVTGRIDHETAPQLETALKAILHDHRHNIVIDLSDVPYISSAGLKTFQATAHSSRHSLLGGDVRLAGLKPNIKEVFNLTGFMELFKIYDRAADAVDSFTPITLPPEAYMPPNV
ncbi:MAG: STAS domain-containing protein [Chloroflexota bacterium]